MSSVIFHTLNCIFFFFLSDFDTNDAPLLFGGLTPGVVKTQDSAIERDLPLSMDDLFHGCTKKIKISRRVRATDFSSSHRLDGELFMDTSAFNLRSSQTL